MPRNLASEAAWAKEKYQRFNFAIDKTVGQNLIEYLHEKGIKQSDWFKTMVEKTLVKEDIILTQSERILAQANEILANVNQNTTQVKSKITQVEKKDEETYAVLKSNSNKQRQLPLFNPFNTYVSNGIDSLQAKLDNLTRQQLYDIISGHELNRHPSKDTTTKEGKHKRYNVFDIKTTSTLVQYILDVVPVATKEEKYSRFLGK